MGRLEAPWRPWKGVSKKWGEFHRGGRGVFPGGTFCNSLGGLLAVLWSALGALLGRFGRLGEMQKVSRGGRGSPLSRLGSQEARERETIETLHQPKENQRSCPHVALSGAIREREITEKHTVLQHVCLKVNVLEISEAV